MIGVCPYHQVVSVLHHTYVANDSISQRIWLLSHQSMGLLVLQLQFGLRLTHSAIGLHYQTIYNMLFSGWVFGSSRGPAWFYPVPAEPTLDWSFILSSIMGFFDEWYMTIGTVKMVYHSTGSLTGTISCHSYGNPLQNSLAFNLRCYLPTTHRWMVLVKEPTKLSTNQSISM